MLNQEYDRHSRKYRFLDLDGMDTHFWAERCGPGWQLWRLTDLLETFPTLRAARWAADNMLKIGYPRKGPYSTITWRL